MVGVLAAFHEAVVDSKVLLLPQRIDDDLAAKTVAADIRRGEVWWVDLAKEPRGSEPGFRRPVLVVQDDYFNRSTLSTIIVVALTRNLALAALPGNVLVARAESGLKHDSVANVTQLVTVDRQFFAVPGRPLGRLSKTSMGLVDKGLALVLSLP